MRPYDLCSFKCSAVARWDVGVVCAMLPWQMDAILKSSILPWFLLPLAYDLCNPAGDNTGIG